jgi:hypothetical protein
VYDLQQNAATRVIRLIIWALAGFVVLVCVILGATAVFLPGCQSCHSSSQFVTQTAAHAHAKVDCVRCHVAPGIAPRVQYAYNVAFGMALRIDSGSGAGPVVTVPDSTCLSCHSDVMKSVVSGNGISIQHSNCSKGRMCVECHSDTAHGSAVQWVETFSMNTCLDCHNATTTRNSCTTCHAGRSEHQLLLTDEWSTTHGSDWKQAHGAGDLKTCASCHDTATFCARCHGIPLPHSADFIKLHPIQALSNRAACSVCHQQTFCDNCHGIPMPHTLDFAPQHPNIVQARGKQLCLHCHVQSDCDNCHLKHVHPGGALLPPRSGT